MSIPRKLVKALPLLAAASIASAGVAWSPIACSCLSGWEDIATGLDHFDVRSPNQINAKFLADAIRDKFSGKAMTARDMPYATSTYDCADSSSPTKTVRCRWWLWESAYGSKKGYDVLVALNARGQFERVVVTPVQHLEREDRK